MKSLDTWFREYGVSHQNKTNKLVHWICVPLIFFSIIGLLASIPLGTLSNQFAPAIQPYVHLGTLLVIFGLLFYARLSIPMAIGILLFSAICLFIVAQLIKSDWVLWQISLIIFATAWIGQFIGHKIEGAKPSFLEDLQFLMIGPAWLMGFIYKKLGIKY